MRLSRFFGAVAGASVSFVLFLSGCTPGQETTLSGPAKAGPSIPAEPPGKHPENQPETPSSGSSAENSTQPTAPSSPTSPTTPRPPGSSGSSAVYRVFCEDRYPPYLKAISSLASSSGFGADIEIDTLKLSNHRWPQVVSMSTGDDARILFSARENGDRFVYVSDVDLVGRKGSTTQLAREIADDPLSASTIINPLLVDLARIESFSVRTFGASDRGRFLMVGEKGGYRLFDSRTLKDLGLLVVGSGTDFVNPQLRESDMLFSVTGLDGSNAFSTRVFSLRLKADGRIQDVTLKSTVGSLRRPLVSAGTSAGESFAALDTSGSFAILNGTSISRIPLSGLPGKGRLTSAAAIWRSGGKLRATIAFEHIVPQMGLTYRVEEAFVRNVSLDVKSLVASKIGSDEEYPFEARDVIQARPSTSARPTITDLRRSSDSLATFVLLPGEEAAATSLYRMTGSGLTRVSQASCVNMSIGVEP